MSDTNHTTIREALNTVAIEGILKEKKLEEKVIKDKDNKDKHVITGYVTIETEDKSSFVVNVLATKYTKNNAINKVYVGLQTVMSEYTSIADLMLDTANTYEFAKERATKVRVTKGSLGINEYYDGEQLVTNKKLTTNFINRIKDDNYNPKATFEVEVFFEKIRKEFKGSEETGRIIVDGIMPIYDRVIPVQFIADGEAAQHIDTMYTDKRTGKIWGNIINTYEKTEIKESGFGAPKQDSQVTRISEWVITGGLVDQYGEDSELAFNIEAIKNAVIQRETIYLPQMLIKSKERKEKKEPVANNSNRPTFNY